MVNDRSPADMEPADADQQDRVIDSSESLDLIPARMVNEFVYCPRLFYLEWVMGEFRHNPDTLEGAALHEHLDREAGTLPQGVEVGPEDRFVARGVLLSAPRLGLIARLDLLEGSQGSVRPVDYKKGSPSPRGPWEPDRVQLCVQGLVLRENGYRCDEGVLYYATTRQRVTVKLDSALVRRTLEVVGQIRQLVRDPVPPPPLQDSPKCPRCSLVGICLPDETNLLRAGQTEQVRRLMPARDEAGPLYILTQGATVGKSAERLVVRKPGGEAEYARLIDVAELSVFGNVHLTAPALRALVEHGVPVLHHTYGGWLFAVTLPVAQRNVLLRLEQYRVAGDEKRSLQIARQFVSGKIRNQRTMLRRNHRDRPTEALDELTRLAQAAENAPSGDHLLGIEGLAAQRYFSLFDGMLKRRTPFNFEARSRRPPTDPVNAVLSFLYSLLVKDALRACVAVGLDPYMGFFHRVHYGRPSLALDLAEEFRPLVSDSVALTLLNNAVLTDSDFVRRGPGCALREAARRAVLDGYERRMQTLVRHPVFGYTISYRRAIEVQARLLVRVLTGELERYRPFRTR